MLPDDKTPVDIRVPSDIAVADCERVVIEMFNALTNGQIDITDTARSAIYNIKRIGAMAFEWIR
jgi:hypothetical protein